MNVNIWQLNRVVTQRLLLWAGVSVIAGVPLWLSTNSFLRGFGLQAVAWGLVDAAIALIGNAMTTRRHNALVNPFADDIVQRESAKLRRLLLINVVLDVGYMIGGIVLALTRGKTDSFWQGTGWGIVVQGAFLLVFDLYHALLIHPELHQS